MGTFSVSSEQSATSNGENAQHLAIGAAASSGVLAIVTAADAVVRSRRPDERAIFSQAESLVVESVPAAACVVGKKPELKFNPSVDRAVE